VHNPFGRLDVGDREEVEAVERRALLKRIVRAQEEERARVAREVHDSITQLAHAAAIHLDNALDLLDGAVPPARAEVERARDLARRAADEARRLIAALRPEALDLRGLPGAIEQEVDALRTTGWRVDLDVSDVVGVRLDPESEITLYRVAQEALTNIRKHAGHARVRVRLTRQNGSVRLEVRDWGRGFDPRTVRPTPDGDHVGLTSMRERLELHGGKLEAVSGPDHGTIIRARLPVSEVVRE
jgi:signal transduction histidine kinase